MEKRKILWSGERNAQKMTEIELNSCADARITWFRVVETLARRRYLDHFDLLEAKAVVGQHEGWVSLALITYKMHA